MAIHTTADNGKEREAPPFGPSAEDVARRDASGSTLPADQETQELVEGNEQNKITHTPTQQHEESLEEVQARENENPAAGRSAGDTNHDSLLSAEREKKRQAHLMESLQQQFRVSGAKFYFKDQPDKLAFRDKGNQLISVSNDERVVKAMIAVAQVKGWQTITVSGHKEFRREIWMQASLQGMDVRGYKPDTQELHLMEERRKRQNKTERDTTRERQQTERMRANARHKEHRRKEMLEAEKRGKEADRRTVMGSGMPGSEKSAKAAPSVVHAVAVAVISTKVRNPVQQEMLQRAIEARLQERARTGNVPALAIYDKSTPARAQPEARSQPTIDRHVEQTR